MPGTLNTYGCVHPGLTNAHERAQACLAPREYTGGRGPTRARPPAARRPWHTRWSCPLALLLLAAVAFASGCAIFPAGSYWPAYRAYLADEPSARRLAAADAPRALPSPAEAAATWAARQEAVTRRWSDEELAGSARSLDAWAGRWIYADALRVLIWCYVDPLSYRRLVASGMESLRAALENETFRLRFPEADDPDKRARFAEAMDILVLKARAADPWLASQAADWLAVVLEKNRAMLGLPDGAVVGEMLFGAVDGLDPYTRFMTAEMVRTEQEQLEEHYVGIGAELASRGGRLFIRRVVEGGPADKAAIKVGDEVVAIDGEAVAGMTLSAAARRLRGKRGTDARLTVRPGGRGDTRDVTVGRATVPAPSVTGVGIIDESAGIGYVHLTLFKANSEDELRKAIRRLQADGMRALIVDLRDNPGGYLESGVGAVGALLAKGRVAETRGRLIGASWSYDVPLFSQVAWDGPLAVLVNGSTASAAELAAAALKRHHRATVVGQRTFGKGAVQIILDMAGSSAVCVTIARVFDPAGECLEGAGVTPDRQVREAPSVADSLRDDPVVRAAIEAIAEPAAAAEAPETVDRPPVDRR